MQNLKITFFMESPLILDRTTTIDGIILSAYYAYLKDKGKVLPFDKEHKAIDFIDKKNNVFSGSIWYIDKDAEVLFDFETIVKKPEYKKIYEFTKKKKANDSLYKAFLSTDETMVVDSIHFYIKAKKEIVENLLKAKVFALGKKQSIGFGVIQGIDVQEVDEEKGYMLNKTTPSKPLPIKDFKVDSKKISQMRTMPPYWLEENLEPCYMPTTALYEEIDNSSKFGGFEFSNQPYIHNCNFLYLNKDNSGIKHRNITIDKIQKIFKTKGSTSLWIEQNNELPCSITGKVSHEGIKNKIRFVINKLKPSFSDYDYFKNNSFISTEALWSIENITEIAYSYVDSNTWLYLQGKKAVDGTRYKDFIKDPTMLKPPFSINLKDTQNAQHVSFKGKVSISNAFITVQYGNAQLQIDNELLQEAIKEIIEITKDKKITKTHLCGLFDKNKSSHIPLKKDFDNTVNRKQIGDFQKRYNTHIRLLLSSVNLE